MQALNPMEPQALFSQYFKDFTCGETHVSASRMAEFMADLDTYGLLLANFSWKDWYHHSHLVDRPEYIAQATAYECMLLLTAMTRLEKFSPGVMENMRRQGVLHAILQRFTNIDFPLAS